MDDILIVGAGPVGLAMGCFLAQAGRRVRVFEAQEGEGAHFRAIGIHPPALEVLAQIGVAQELVECGMPIERARVYEEGRLLGALTFESCPGPYRFVLTVPQPATERVLRARLEELAPGSLRTGSRVTGVRAGPDRVTLQLADGREVSGGFVVGADGRRSTVREAVGVGYTGGAHDHHYVMADMEEAQSGGPAPFGGQRLGTDAAIILSRAGVVEAFPLPGGRRRWVARTPGRVTEDVLPELQRAVAQRSGVRLAGEVVACSAFTAESRQARRMLGDWWALVGDAAHVVSPIGGQGMNLGLLGVPAVGKALLAGALPGGAGRLRRRAAAASRRALLNMALGSAGFPPLLRSLAVRSVLSRPLRARAARYFTMRGLP